MQDEGQLTGTDCVIFDLTSSSTKVRKTKLHPKLSASVLNFLARTKFRKFSFVTGYLSITNGFTPTVLAGSSPRFLSADGLPMRYLPPDSLTSALKSSLPAHDMSLLHKVKRKLYKVQMTATFDIVLLQGVAWA